MLSGTEADEVTLSTIIPRVGNAHLQQNPFQILIISYERIGRLTLFHAGLGSQSDARSTGDQEVVSSRLRSGNILSLRSIMKSFLRSLFPFR